MGALAVITWLAGRMGQGDYNVVFVDQQGTVIYETITSGIPRVGDHVDLPRQQVAGIVDRVTWQVTEYDRSSRAFIRLAPHPA